MATILTTFLPAKRTKEIFIVIFILIILGIYSIGKVIEPSASSFGDINDILRLVAAIQTPNKIWLPSYWSAQAIGSLLENGPLKNVLVYITLLCSSALAIGSFSYLTVRLLHHFAYSKSKTHSHGLKLNTRKSFHRLVRLTPFLPQYFRAILQKDVKSFTRDLTQAIQLLLLLALCLVYLYNFKLMKGIQGLPENTKMWWQGFLVIANIAMGAFVVVAVCTRFVFPTVSLEGKSFWTIQSSPLTEMEYLKAKFWIWFVPVSIVSSIVFASGSLAIDAEYHIIIINSLASWIICYGIVGLGVGLGAHFANFDWEHSSQLAASLGSLIYMLVCTVLICINLLPAGSLIFLRTLKNYGYQFSSFEWYVAVALSTVLLSYVNYFTCLWALKLGERSLQRKLNPASF